MLNELWKFSNGEWARKGESKVSNQMPSFGAQGIREI